MGGPWQRNSEGAAQGGYRSSPTPLDTEGAGGSVQHGAGRADRKQGKAAEGPPQGLSGPDEGCLGQRVFSV